ncbi:hypothetical protein EKD16_02915 [Streptomonospora litoralis]|uniref:Uncharacterized protein n=1 Tax=Streptomonospora litoralis TaxID=2498135 RepID=A0A4P6PW61_9ACTN|nr:hypothetical protein EKD16_02915 [Streptomonospora litoralis]
MRVADADFRLSDDVCRRQPPIDPDAPPEEAIGRQEVPGRVGPPRGAPPDTGPAAPTGTAPGEPC